MTFHINKLQNTPDCFLIRILCIILFVGLLAGCTTSPQMLGSESGDGSTYDAQSSHGATFRVDGTISEPLPKLNFAQPAYRTQTVDLTFNTDDLAQRIRHGFSMPDINSDLVLYHQQRYQSKPDYLRRMVERSRPYLYHIVEELDKRGMPMELVFLPMVESAYNPMALSRAKALGLWQFIPSTGKRFNLDQDWWKDERRDIVASTAAALDYLQIIYEMHGDWHLALASYNWGEGSVARAISKNAALGLPTDYLNLTMPEETKNYVPKLQALKNIFSNPLILAELGVPSIPNSPYFMTVTKDEPIDVKLAAKLAEMPLEEFVALNPAHNRPVIKSDTPMVIPAHRLDTFMSNLEEHEESNKPLSAWQAYTLRPGDKLEKVALRFGMTVANLKAVNGINGRIKVGPGHTLLVASTADGDPVKMMEPLPQQPRYLDSDKDAKKITYQVRKNDTLHAIATRHGISVAELKRTNQLQGNTIKPGTNLSISVAKGKNTSSGNQEKASQKKNAKSAKASAKKTTSSASASRSGKRSRK